jgi:Ca2+-binding RTX toxin-like protein
VTGTDEGGDYLDGGAGNDQLFGNGGADILIGGPGVDTLVGGAGKDIYVFNKGDGTETVFDTPASANDPEASILVTGEGINRSDIKFRTGSFMVDFGGGDTIHFEGFDQLNPANSPMVSEIRFADGTSMSYADILEQGFDIDGTEDSDDNHDAAHPQLVGTGVTDRIRGLGGNDIIAGIGGDDILDGGAGNDLIVGGAGDDLLIGGIGFDQLQGGSGNDNLQGGDGNDQLFGDADDATEATSGDDVLDGGTGDDFLFGNAGNDTLYGGEGADNLQGQAGSDVLEGDAGNDFLYGDGIYEFQGEFFVNLFDDGALDILRGGDGDDQLDAGAGDDVLDGGAGVDTLFAGTGNDLLSGGDGNDQLVGGGGDDQLGGGTGDDTLLGEAGNDTYLFNLGDGRDLIVEDSAIDTEVLRFGAGIVLGDLTFSRTAGDLVISHANGTDEVTIANWYSGTGFQMTRLEFADGSVLSGTDAGNRGLQLQRGTEGNDTLAGTTGNDTFFGLGGNDTIFGNAGNDTLIGGTGNDTLNASSGNDTFRFAPGDGADTITDTGGSDALVFGAGIAKSEITPSRAGGDLVLTRTATSDMVKIRDWFNSLSNKIESITFAGTGEAFTDAELVTPFLTFNGTAATDTFAGGAYNETFSGLGGADVIQAGGGDDDITGGAGNDNLFGDAGFDTFHFALGDGQDTVNDSDGFGVVHFGPGLVDKVVFTSVSGGRLVTFTGTSDSVLIKAPTISTFNRVQTKFDILGTEGNDTITGSAFNDVIQGLGGTDAINGGNGADEIFGGAGNDILEGGGSDTDSSRDSLFGGEGDDILDSGLRTGTGDVGGALTGGPGNDQLFGSSGTDFYFFNSGDGQDIINDESLFANNQTIFSPEDALIFGPGITRDTIGARFSGADVIVQVDATDSVTLKNWTNPPTRVDFLRFADGTSMDAAAIQELALTITGTAGNDTLTGTAQADTIRGLGGDDTISGLDGDDKLTGGPGNDIVDGGSGNDRYFFNSGDGEDRIIDTSGTDTLQFGTGISASDVTLGRSANSLVLTLADGAGSITIDNYLSDPARRIETLQFPDGSTLPDATTIVDTLVNIRGTPGDDTLVGTPGFDILTGFEGNDSLSGLGDNDLLFAGPGNDTLAGGPGTDTMDGGSGADTYLFNLGDGADLIIDPDTGGRVQFGAGISPQGVAATRSGNALTLSVTGTTDQLSVSDYFVNFQIGEFAFADGTAWDVQTIKNFALTGTAGDDTLVGFDSDDVIQGLGGNDQLFGGAGNDTIDGGTGSDFLSGDDGDDVLVAGNGDNARAGVVNTLDGGTGNDVLIAGDTSSNQMSGDSGLDLYIGGAGSDQMSDTSGRSLFYAKDGTDQFAGSDDNDLYIGGTDNDAIDGDSNGNGLSGSDIVLFNRADGKDTVVRLGQATALSLGGMTGYSQLKFDRNGTALIVKVGHNSITFNDWYDTTAPGSRVANLQIMAETLRRFDPASTDPLFNQKVQVFDFPGLVAAWDQAQANRQRFVVADHLAEFRLSGSDTQAFGGEVAYQYGTTGTLDALSFAQMQAVINAPEFGAQPQAIGTGASPVAITVFASTSDAADPGTETLAPTTTSILTDSTMIDLLAGDAISTDSTVQTIAAGDSSSASGAPADTLQQNLQARIDNWFDEAQYRQAYGLSAFYQSSAYADGVRVLEAGDPAANAAQWDRIARRLPLHLAQYADGGLDLHEGAFSDAFGTSFFGGGTPIVNAVGLSAVPSNSLKGFQGLKEGLTRLA